MKRSQALNLLAITFLALGGFALSPGDDASSSLSRQAEAHIARKEYNSAILRYKEALALNPDRRDVRQRLLETYLLKKKPDSAKALLEDWARLDPGDPQPHISLGALLESQGQMEAAMDQLQKALSLEPQHREARHRLADIYLVQGRFDRARVEFEMLLTQDGADQRAHLKLGAILAGGEMVNAQIHLRQAVEIGADSLVTGTAEEILATLMELQNERDRAYAAAALGFTFVKVREVTLAHRQFEEATKLDPGYVDAQAYLGYTWLLQRRLDLAGEALERATTLGPSSAFAHHIMGNVARAQGKTEEALDHLRRAEALDPSDPFLLTDIAITYLIAGDLNTTEEYYVKAAAIARSDRIFVEQLARFYLDRMFKLDEGLAVARRLAELSHGAAEDLDLLGWALYLNGNAEEAEKILTEAVKANPNLASAHYHLAVLWTRAGQTGKAKMAYERAAELDLSGQIEKRALASLEELQAKS